MKCTCNGELKFHGTRTQEEGEIEYYQCEACDKQAFFVKPVTNDFTPVVTFWRKDRHESALDKANRWPMVFELINHLKKFPFDSELAYDDNGNTGPLSIDAFKLWDERDPDTVVALFVKEI